MIKLSLVVPVFDEEDNVLVLAKEIDAALALIDYAWECVWVNDGSRDSTKEKLEELAKSHPRHSCVSLEANMGQSAALAAGIRKASGEVVATLDGDGQNDPNDIPKLLKRLEQGDVDMVNGVRQHRQDTLVRKLSSRIGNGFRNLVTREQVTDVGCSLRVFCRSFALEIPVFKGMHRFLPTLCRMRGCRVTELPVHHRPRLRGQAKYGIGNRLWVGLGDTLAVYWMQKRLVWPRIAGESKNTKETGT